MTAALLRLKTIDSHTGGEPTRVVTEGFPALKGKTASAKLQDFRANYDAYRSAVVNEPRGSDVVVGALLTDSEDASCVAGVLFFNNVGTLGMCGHGTMGVVATLAYMGRIGTGVHRLETPVGVVEAELHETGEISVRNVPCYRHAKQVAVEVPGYGRVVGDVAWGGNWFYLVEDHHQSLEISNVEALIERTWAIRQALKATNITGREGQEIDHIEFFAPSQKTGVHSKNFVLCPGKAYDRSPCGTGTSAKLACLFADGKLKEGETWVQESVVGSLFSGSVRQVGDALIPTLRGTAFVTGESTLILNPEDPFCWGIR